MPANATARVRIACPSRDLEAAERLRVSGLGILYRHTPDGTPGDHPPLMAGRPHAAWHFELTRGPTPPTDPRPTRGDPLVIHLDEPEPDLLAESLERHGGKPVPAHNPYWDTWGVAGAGASEVVELHDPPAREPEVEAGGRPRRPGGSRG